MQHSSSPDWIATSVNPPLQENEIHIWRISRSELPCRLDCLTEEERQRLSTFDRSQRRELYCHTRASLRTLLSAYLGIPPEKVPIRTGHRGKPFVVDEVLHFNLTHARDTILLALSTERPLGIDLEYPRRLRNISRIAGRVFSPGEVARLAASDRPQQRFLAYWTRFEASQKCSGEGIFGNRADRESMSTCHFPVGDGVACLAWRREASVPGMHFFDYLPVGPGT